MSEKQGSGLFKPDYLTQFWKGRLRNEEEVFWY